MSGLQLIAAERQRQIDVENWSEQHDDQHGYKVIESAAYCYRDASNADSAQTDCWPWSPIWWKPKVDNVTSPSAAKQYLVDAVNALFEVIMKYGHNPVDLMLEKMDFNTTRPDHLPENRQGKVGQKAY